MVAAADKGEIDLSDYWAVGDERIITLPAMEAINVGETHVEQEVTLVLLNKGGKFFATIASECSFIVGLKDCLNEVGYMNSTNTNNLGWYGTARRAWCNEEFKDAMLSTGIGSIFKQHWNLSANEYNSTQNGYVMDWFALPAAKEIFGGDTATSAGSATSYSNLTEFNALKQFSYYTDSGHRVKKRLRSGTMKSAGWFGRSPYYNENYSFCTVISSGLASWSGSGNGQGIAPYGCI